MNQFKISRYVSLQGFECLKGCQVTIPLDLIGTPLEGAGIYVNIYTSIYTYIYIYVQCSYLFFVAHKQKGLCMCV